MGGGVSDGISASSPSLITGGGTALFSVSPSQDVLYSQMSQDTLGTYPLPLIGE
jgi:hypothetical protein